MKTKTYIAVNEYNEIIFENDNKEQIIDCIMRYLCYKYHLNTETYANNIYTINNHNSLYTIKQKIQYNNQDDKFIIHDTIELINTSTTLQNIKYDTLINRNIFIVNNNNNNNEIYRDNVYNNCYNYIFTIIDYKYQLNGENNHKNDKYELIIEDESYFKIKSIDTDIILDEYNIIENLDYSIEFRDKVLDDIKEDIEFANTFISFQDKLKQTTFPTAQEARIMIREIEQYNFAEEKQQILREIYKGNSKFTIAYKKEELKKNMQHVLIFVEMLTRLGYEIGISIVKDEVKIIISWQ